MSIQQKVPVTILTGFLGSGKTTLLNRILSEEHGKRIAVIENEYGEVGIDQGLVINADEEVFEMSNGCICCTVRGDLIRVLGNLMKRRDKFDYVLVETTGLADPGPVAQTFFMDDEIRDEFSLDGIVTLVDAAHIDQQIGRSDESSEQVAFADVLVLNKTDLVSTESLNTLEMRLRDMNRMARVIRSKQADVSVDTVLNLNAFDLDEVLKRRPTFLEPEYPFEWTGVFKVDPGRYEVSLDEGPDPTMSIVVISDQGTDESSLKEGAETSVRLYAEPALSLAPNSIIPIEKHVTLQLQSSGRKSFIVEATKKGTIGMFTQHTAEEFDIKVRRLERPTEDAPENQNETSAVSIDTERVWVAEHEHDDEVGTFAIERSGNVDPEKMNAWMGQLLAEKGVDIFRTKGFISYEGESRRIVFQGVHMLFTAQPDQEWGNEPRRNQLVFIGRNLDEEEMRRGFDQCLI
ncbi:MAG: cobalamin biosynthesis protein CobW [Cyanobium sp. NAT70]|nr:cobalamin biosynthesis protein CobW [Cyanobium sp. NAT70]|tara:strand:- start:3501 stop:4883 length:1383 start_codon:yes stop_codon:yes gene_type:complete